jgi:hypothetical protein
LESRISKPIELPSVEVNVPETLAPEGGLKVAIPYEVAVAVIVYEYEVEIGIV